VAGPGGDRRAVITGQIFAWNGMGQLAVDAAGARDPS
jgi:ABC-type dipeptide/oligopeptide/nickel transport system permease component